MKRFINDKETIVTEALEGLVGLAGAGSLARLDGYPHIKVITRASIDPTKVALLSGGGAGHEPAHAGFVGEGMLTAAVSGEIFASPSVEAVYAAIMATTGEAGCLLIVKNYTGDRLNFGLAAERARGAGKQVEMVIVADDTAIPDAPQPRGVAGTLFVHKIAGHLAEQGADLQTVTAAARAAAADIWSLGMSLSSCTIPGQPSVERLAEDEGELGLGIHGEPGVEKISLPSVQALVALMVERLEASLPQGDHQYAALINNLGAVPAIEMSVIAHELLRSPLKEQLALVIGPAPLMTSLDMNGFSLSLLKLDDTRREALESPCAPVSWPGVFKPTPVALRPLPTRAPQTEAAASSDPVVEKAMSSLLSCLIEQEERLNALDAKIGDGDTGSTFATAARSLQSGMEGFPFAAPALLLQVIGERLAESMGGSSGVLLSIFCTAAGQAYTKASSWVDALSAGLARMQEYGGAQLGDRTMIDALVPAVSSLQDGGSLSDAAAAANAGAESTASMTQARAGRASYLSSDSLDGVPDPGAVATAEAFKAIAEALS